MKWTKTKSGMNLRSCLRAFKQTSVIERLTDSWVCLNPAQGNMTGRFFNRSEIIRPKKWYSPLWKSLLKFRKSTTRPKANNPKNRQWSNKSHQLTHRFNFKLSSWRKSFCQKKGYSNNFSSLKTTLIRRKSFN
jgi:hypothetical protein